MHAEEWIIGPQLIGFVFIMAGFIQKRFPPKRINNWYGYRMPSAMKNQQTWDEANRFAATYMIRLGLILLVIGFSLTTCLQFAVLKEDAWKELQAVLLIVASLTTAVLLITGTEKHMSKTFDSKPL